MATFTLLVWLPAFAMFIWLAISLLSRLPRSDHPDETTAVAGVASVMTLAIGWLWLFITFGITSALVFDIYGVTLGGHSAIDSTGWWFRVLIEGEELPSGITRTAVMFIAGLVALGTCSAVALAYNVFKGRKSYYYTGNNVFRFGRIGSFVIQSVGLVASILGIISFYLDYFR